MALLIFPLAYGGVLIGTTIADQPPPIAAVQLAPVLVTIAVYGIAWLIARRNEERS